jgi:hypothetical protein
MELAEDAAMRTVATGLTRRGGSLEFVQQVELKDASAIVFVEMLLGNVTKMGVRAKMDFVQLVVLKAALVIALVGISQWVNVMKMGATGSLMRRMDLGRVQLGILLSGARALSEGLSPFLATLGR